MAEVSKPPLKSRKSVAFSEGTTVVDENGDIRTMADTSLERKTTAESHSTAPVADPATANASIADASDDMFKGLTKKKKKKPKADGEDEGADEKPATPADGTEFDPTALKKKKKKKPKAAEGDDFTAKLVERGLGEADGDEDGAEPASSNAQEGDMDVGTGIWQHDSNTPIGYPLLLSRFFTQLHKHHPDLASSGSKSYKIPPPQCLREGNKKTIFANISDICNRMKRSDEHVTQYLFAELGTTGSTDGSRRLVIKGRFQQKQLENVLKRYIMEYVTCKTCRSPETELSKGENRLYFVTCISCGSRRSVTAIKSGFSAQIGKRKLKKQG